MKKLITTVLVCFLLSTLFLSASTVFTARAENEYISSSDLEGLINSIIGNPEDLVNPENIGSSSTDWYAFSVARLLSINGQTHPKFNPLTLLASINHKVQIMIDNKNFARPTDYHRFSLIIDALGGDSTKAGDYGDIDLIDMSIFNCMPINEKRLERQGLNAYIWALICLNSKNYSPNEGAFYDLDDILSYILNVQLSSGGFALTGSAPDADITAMTIIALAPHYEKFDIAIKVNKALECLRGLQQENGGFKSMGSEGVESISQVIIALTSLGIDPVKDFVKPVADGSGKNVNLLDALLRYRSGNFFFNPASPNEKNDLATSQALCALISYKMFIDNNKAFFDLSHVEPLNTVFNADDLTAANELPEKVDTSYYTKVVSLLYKATRTEDVNQNVINALLNKLLEIDRINFEIETIKKTIEGLPAVNSLKLSDRSAINTVKERLNALSEHDRIKAGSNTFAVYTERMRRIYINTILYIVLAAVIIASIAFFVIRHVKRRKRQES